MSLTILINTNTFAKEVQEFDLWNFSLVSRCCEFSDEKYCSPFRNWFTARWEWTSVEPDESLTMSFLIKLSPHPSLSSLENNTADPFIVTLMGYGRNLTLAYTNSSVWNRIHYESFCLKSQKLWTAFKWGLTVLFLNTWRLPHWLPRSSVLPPAGLSFRSDSFL